MVGEFKDFYFRGYAEAVSLGKRAGGVSAANVERSQLYALRYGYSSLADLHRGLDEASWNFFFALIGPVGELLEDLKFKKLSLMIKYQKVQYGLDYLMKTLPEEKAFDLIYDHSKKLIYYLGKLTSPLGLTMVSKITHDQYGRRLYQPQYTFSPLIKFQMATNTVSNIFERLTVENSISDLYSNYQQALGAYHRDELPFEKMAKFRRDYNTGKAELDKHWLLNPLYFLEKSERGRRAREIYIARFARTLGFKSLAKNSRRTDRDIISYFAFLIGGWIFDVTVGNLARIVGEKIASTAVWQKLTVAAENFFNRPLFRSFNLAGRVVGDFVGGVPSLNTLAGGYLGFTFLGPIGIPIGTGFGISYQWILNMAKDRELMNLTGNYSNVVRRFNSVNSLYKTATEQLGHEPDFLQKELGRLRALEKNFFYDLKDLRLNAETFAKLPKWQQQLIKIELRLANVMSPGGYITRFANWLRSPVGSMVRFPLKGWASSVLIEQLHALGMPLPEWYGSWMPPALQYFWEIKGPLFEGIGNFFVNRVFFPTWHAIGFEANSVRVFEFTAEEFSERGFGRWLANETPNLKIIRVQYLENGMVRVELGQFKPFFQKINGFFGQSSPLFRNLRAFDIKLSRTAPARWIQNFFNPGFFLGWEMAALLHLPFWAYIPAAIFGSGAYAAATWLYWNVFGVSKFGLGFKTFLGRVSLGGFLGWGVGTILETFFGIPNAGLIGTIIGSVIPILAVSLASTFGWTWILNAGSAVGAFFTGALSSLGISAATTAVLSTVFAVVAVATFTIFIFFIVGSAFWIPLQESLQGITNVSPCFSIDNPVFSDNKPTFKNGETKEICWTTTNQTELYQNAISKEKGFKPPENFEIKGYTVTVSVPGTNPITWQGDITIGIQPQPGPTQPNQNGFNLDIEKKYENAGELGPGLPRKVTSGLKFNLLPPPDTQGIFKKQVVAELQNIAQDNRDQQELISEVALQQAAGLVQASFLLDKEIEFLESIRPEDTKEALKIRADEKLKNVKQDIKNNSSTQVLSKAQGYDGTTQTVAVACATWNLVKNSQPTPPFPYCAKFLDGVNGVKDSLSGQADNFFSTVSTINQQEIADRIKLLKRERDQQTGPADSATKQRIDMIKNVKSAYDKPPINLIDPKILQEFQKKLDDIASHFNPGSTLYYLPIGSTIKVCLNVTYTGNDNAAATITEKDSAVLPLLGPLTTNFCQAQVATPINNNGPAGQIACPTTSCKTNGTYGNDHKGRDFAGKMFDPVRASVGGTVVREGTGARAEARGFGNYVIIKGDDGFYYLYGHLESLGSNTKEGTRVGVGDEIGKMGNSGNATGVHVHVGISTSPDVTSFYNNSNTTFDPCLYIAGGCK
ncbi:peptidoglycan DD-metalloendopeptidase family protein [Candidatus Gottesmanbacteria bacterium]|nr:peptidoglycan DD-metalloendopeptidase family protein [Candidatus Gottesmanbacteria bacterium]